MKVTAILAAALSTAALTSANPIFERAPKCAADNCARAVTGTAKAVATAKMADCSSFFLTTVTPSPIWKTVTVETPVHVRIGIVVQNKEVTRVPSDVPAYASACSGTVRYSSACACAGATTGTTRLPARTYTVTVGPTATAVTTAVV